VSDPIDEALPFTEKRGVLYIAPLGSELPDLTVASDPPGSGINTRFVMSWPAGWIRPKPYDPANPDSAFTDPRVCSVRNQVDTDSIQVDAFSPIRSMVTSRTALWDFGPELGPRMRRILSSPLNVTAAPRFMVGWESEDCLDRVIARQAVVDEYGLFHLEQPIPPRVPAPRRTWWQRLLDRLMRRPAPTSVQPLPEPLFHVYRVGVQRRTA
jgi:hypothetical protein